MTTASLKPINTDAMSLPLLATLGGKRCMREPATDGYVRAWLDHFLWVAAHADTHHDELVASLGIVKEGTVRPMCRPDERAYCCLAYLLTGEHRFAELARVQVLRAAASVDQRERGDVTQKSVWCDAFPMARWMAFYDWIADSGVFSEQERRYIVDRFRYYVWAHPYQLLRARPITLTPCNNQNASLAFACVVGGYLFGVKHNRDSHSQRMMQEGLEHLTCFLTAFPSGGYSFEGSTYMGRINSMLIPMGLEAVQAVTGVDLLDRRRDGACATPREVLRAVARLAMPSGLALPWDNYGYDLADYTPGLAYLASRTGETAALRWLVRRGALERPKHMGWGFDKNLWSTLYLPRDLDLAAPDDWSFNHAERSVGASATGPAQRLYAFQMWDRSHWPPNRAQFNPNALVVEYDGAPLLLDGRCVELAKSDAFAAPCYRHRRADTGAEVSVGPGTVGAHNTVFLDGAPEYASKRSTEGHLLWSAYTSHAAAFEADVTDCFRDAYDVRRVRRGTLVLGDELMVVRDRIQSATPHDVNWRAHLRDGVLELDGARAALTTPENVRLEVCVPRPDRFEHRQWRAAADTDAVDAQLECACHELTYQKQGRDVELFTMLVPSAGTATWRVLNDGWYWRRAEHMAEATRLARAWPGGEQIAVDKGSWFYTSATHQPGVGVYRHAFTIDALPAGRVWLRLPRLPRGGAVVMNSQVKHVEKPIEHMPLLPPNLDITGSLQVGTNVLFLLLPATLETALCGVPELRTELPSPPPAALSRQPDGSFLLVHHGRTDTLWWDDQRCVVERDDGQRIDLDAARDAHHVSRAQSQAMSNSSDLSVDAVTHGFNEAPVKQMPAEALAAQIRDGPWRVALAALEVAEWCSDQHVRDAALHRLRQEMQTHRPRTERSPSDLAWYRLQAAAARTLGSMRETRAVPALIDLLHSDAYYPVRSAAATALGRIRTPDAIRALQRVTDADEPNVRAAIERILSTVGIACP